MGLSSFSGAGLSADPAAGWEVTFSSLSSLSLLFVYIIADGKAFVNSFLSNLEKIFPNQTD